MLKVDVSFVNSHGGVGATEVDVAGFANSPLLILDDLHGPSKDVAEEFNEGEVGVAVTTRLPDNGYFAIKDNGVGARKEFMKEYMNHAMFTCTVKNPQGQLVTFTVSAPRIYAAGLFNNPSDTADEEMPRQLRRENANPSILLRMMLPKHDKIDDDMKARYMDNLRTWMVIAGNYAVFPWNSYNGGDSTYTIDLARIRTYGMHLLRVLHEWKNGEPYLKYSKSAEFLRSPQNLVYCAEFVHVVLNLGYNVPLNARTLHEMGFNEVEIEDIRAKLKDPKKYRWIKSRNNWPPRDKDDNVQVEFPNGQLDPDMLGPSDYLNQGAHIYLEWVPLTFLGEDALEPLYKVVGAKHIPFPTGEGEEVEWYFDPALAVPVSQPESLLHESALLYSKADDEFSKEQRRPYATDLSYIDLYHGNWKSVVNGLLAGLGAGSGSDKEESPHTKAYRAFLKALKMPKETIEVLVKMPLQVVDYQVMGSANVRAFRLHLLRKCGMDKKDYIDEVNSLPAEATLPKLVVREMDTSKKDKEKGKGAQMMNVIKMLVKQLTFEDVKSRRVAQAALTWGTRERGDGQVSLVPPHIYTRIARNFRDPARRNNYHQLIQFDAVGFALDGSLIQNPRDAAYAEVPFCKYHMQHAGGRHPHFPNSKNPIVLVAGAGVAGLATAQKLVDSGCNVVMVEARDRVGGRIHTVAGIDHGSMFLGPRDPQRNPLVERLMISKGRLPNFRFVDLMHGVNEQTPRTLLKKVKKRLNSEKTSLYRLFFEDASVSSKLITAMKGLLDNRGKYKVWKHYLAPYGSDGRNMSFRGIINNDVRYNGLPWDQTTYTKANEGSMEAVNGYLRSLLKAPNFKLLLEHELVSFGSCHGPSTSARHGTSPRPRANTMAVRTKDAIWCRARVKNTKKKEAIKMKYDVLVSALPLGVVKKNLPRLMSGKTFKAFYEGRKELLDQLHVGHVCKVIVQIRGANAKDFVKKFRFTPDNAPVADQIWVYQEPRRPDVLSYQASGDLADRLSRMSEREIAGYTSRRLKIATSLMQKVHATHWNTDPYSLGTHPYFGTGARLSAMKLASAFIGNRLGFAGDWTNHENYGTAAGAAISGYRVAKYISMPIEDRRIVHTASRTAVQTKASDSRREAKLWFFRGNSKTRDSRGRGANEDDVQNVLLRAGHLGISDDKKPLMSRSKRIYGWMPIPDANHKGDLFAQLMSGKRLKGRCGDDIQAFRDAAESSEGFVLCSLVLNEYHKYGVCTDRHCGMKRAERAYVKSSKLRGSYTGLDGQYYAFPPAVFKDKAIKWKEEWDKNTFNCITWPKEIGIRLDKLPRSKFRSLKNSQIIEFANSGRASHIGLLLGDFVDAKCQCWKRGVVQDCNACGRQAKYCLGEPMKKYLRPRTPGPSTNAPASVTRPNVAPPNAPPPNPPPPNAAPPNVPPSADSVFSVPHGSPSSFRTGWSARGSGRTESRVGRVLGGLRSRALTRRRRRRFRRRHQRARSRR